MDGIPKFNFVHKHLQDGTPQKPALAKGQFAFRYLQPLKVNAETLKVRVAVDLDLQEEIEDLQKFFYFLDELGEFVSEVEEI